jgi:phospholipase D1/2
MRQHASTESGDILAAGRNCQRLLDATRVAFLVDADAYFEALTETILGAREQVLVIGWDIQAATRLRAGGT